MNDHAKEIIAICVCTYQRPKMLTRCFLSLIQQQFLPHWEIIFIIVDNEIKSNNRALVDGFCTATNFSVYYVHQPQRGIACARNAALEKALQHHADWIAFFDDDQYVNQETLLEAYQTAQRYKAAVVSMALKFVDEKSSLSEFQMLLHHGGRRSDGKIIKKCGTGGVLFHNSLILSDQFNLRFDPAFKLRQGEDSDFFFRAHLLGAKIVFSSKALVFEEMVPQRTTVRFYWHSSYCYGVSKFNFYWRYQKKKICLRIFFKCFFVLELFVLPIYLFIGLPFLKYRIIKIGSRFFWCLGFLTAFLQLNITRYGRNVAGY